jgi:hypothetical protein
VNSSLSLFCDLFGISVVAMEMGDALNSKKMCQARKHDHV